MEQWNPLLLFYCLRFPQAPWESHFNHRLTVAMSPKAQDIRCVSKVIVKGDKGSQTEVPANLCRTEVNGRKDAVDPL